MNLFPLIAGKLYQAGTENEITLLFLQIKPTVVIDCTYDLPLVGLRVTQGTYIKTPFEDRNFPSGAHGIQLITRLSSIARMGAELLRTGERILTHCSPGENRSSLVNALILLEQRQMGIFTFKNVVDYIHNVRPAALTNAAFIAYLNGQCGLT